MTRQKLKAAIERARSGGPRGHYSPDLKSAIVAYGISRREEGASWGQISQELGVGENQVGSWCRGGRGAPGGGRGLRAVSVVSDPPSRDSEITLTLTGGEVVHGLNADSLAALLKALR